MSSIVFTNSLDNEINLSVNGRVKAILSPGDTIAIDVPAAATVAFAPSGMALPAPAPASLAATLTAGSQTQSSQTALVVATNTGDKSQKYVAKPVTQYRGNQPIQTFRSVRQAAFASGENYWAFLSGLQNSGGSHTVGEFTYRYGEATSADGDATKVVSQEQPRRAGKRIMQLDLSGNPLRMWDSQTIAGEQLGIDKSSISKVCNGFWHSAGGFRWKFAQA